MSNSMQYLIDAKKSLYYIVIKKFLKILRFK